MRALLALITFTRKLCYSLCAAIIFPFTPAFSTMNPSPSKTNPLKVVNQIKDSQDLAAEKNPVSTPARSKREFLKPPTSTSEQKKRSRVFMSRACGKRKNEENEAQAKQSKERKQLTQEKKVEKSQSARRKIRRAGGKRRIRMC